MKSILNTIIISIAVAFASGAAVSRASSTLRDGVKNRMCITTGSTCRSGSQACEGISIGESCTYCSTAQAEMDCFPGGDLLCAQVTSLEICGRRAVGFCGPAGTCEMAELFEPCDVTYCQNLPVIE